MRKKTISYKIVSIFTMISFLYACSIHSLREVPSEKIFDHNEKNILLIHKDSLIFEIIQPQILNDSLKGTISLYSKPSDKKNYKEFHLYLSPLSEQQIKQGNTLAIPVSEIEKLELYKISPGKILGVTFFGILAFYIIGFIIIGMNGGIGIGMSDMNVSFEGNK